MSQAEKPYQENCSICGAQLFSAHDCHNASPVKSGFCCHQCNCEIVIPRRLGILILDIKVDNDKEE